MSDASDTEATTSTAIAAERALFVVLVRAADIGENEDMVVAADAGCDRKLGTVTEDVRCGMLGPEMFFEVLLESEEVGAARGEGKGNEIGGGNSCVRRHTRMEASTAPVTKMR